MNSSFLSTLFGEILEWRSTYFFRRPVLIALTLYCVGIFATKGLGFFDRVGDDDPSHWIGERCAFVGVVAEQPDPRPTGCVYLINTESIELFNDDHERHACRGQILLHIMQSTVPIASPGDRVRFYGRPQQPRASLTPGAFDYQAYLADQDVHTLIYTGPHSVENLGNSGSLRWTRRGWILKQKGVDLFYRYLNPDQATVLSGLVLGNRPRFQPEIKRIFIESGTMHLLVASGSNVAFVIAMCFLCARILRFPNRFALAASVPFVWMYVLLAGADGPIVRAGVMGTIAVISYLLNREDRPVHVLGLAGLIILVLNPRALFNIGFQMSFVTVFGLIHFLTPLEGAMSSTSNWIRWPVRLAATTLTAQLWLIPITAATFQRFFPISLISNLFVVPLSGLGFVAGITVAVANVADFARSAALFFVGIYLNSLIGLVRFFADYLGNSFWVASPPIMAIIGFYIVCLFVIGIRRSAFCRVVVPSGIILISSAYAFDYFQKPRPKTLTITWIDTGRHLTTLIETSRHERLLLNPGPLEPVDTTERVLMPFLVQQGIRKLDAVILTDPEPERTASIASLVKWVDVSTVEVCGQPLLWISDGKNRILIADVLTLKMQDYLLKTSTRKFQVIQSHFPRNWKWRQQFLDRFKPEVLVETNMVSDFRPTVPPWPRVKLIVPQQQGWARWSAKGNLRRTIYD